MEAAETMYDVEKSLALRDEVIQLRDKALAENNFHATVVLSHAIAWMHEAVKRLSTP